MTESGERRMLNVSERDLGCWIAGASENNPFEFNVKIVDLAISLGFELDTEAWEKDRPEFLNGEPTFDMVEDLGFASEAAVDYLQSLLPEGFYFEFEDGLYLFFEEEA